MRRYLRIERAAGNNATPLGHAAGRLGRSGVETIIHGRVDRVRTIIADRTRA
jgi:hypothetical protein